MKQNRLFKTLFVLLLVVLGYTNMQAQGTVAGDAAPYAVLSENTNGGLVLTFYCDDQKTARNGMDVGPFENAGGRGWENARTNITTVVFDDSFANCTELTSTAFWFYGCDHLTEIVGISNLKTDNVTNMEWMFRGCSGLTILDVSGFKTENVFDFGLMFMDCSSLTSLDISNFKTDNMLYMNYMFYDCSGLTTLDMSNFKTDKVTAIDHMFYNCSGLTTIYAGNDWTTAAVTSGEDVFAGCTNLVGGKGTAYNPDHVDYTYARIDGGPNSQTPGYFTDKNAPVVTDPEPYAALSDNNTVLTFYYDDKKAERNGMSVGTQEWFGVREDITTVVFDDSFADCTSLTSTAFWFRGCGNITTIVGLENLKTDNVTTFEYMFNGCGSLTSLDLSTFNTENVTTMALMFWGCAGLTDLNLTSFNTTKVQNMSSMFYGCSGLTTLDLSSFNTSNVTNMNFMFYNCTGLVTVYVSDKWSTESVTEGSQMFDWCTSIVGGEGTAYCDKKDYDYAHIDYGPGTPTPGYFTDINASVVTGPKPYAVLSDNNTVLTFYYDEEKTARGGMDVVSFSLPTYRGWHSEAPNIQHVVFDESFAQCHSLRTTAFWFREFHSLTTITGLENLNTENVANMRNMFYDCIGLPNLDLSGLNTSNVIDMYEMFMYCRNLSSLKLDGFGTESATTLGFMFDDCRKLTTLDISSFNTSKVQDMGFMFSGCTSLKTIYVGSEWSTENVTDGNSMFSSCYDLVGGAGTVYDENNINQEYARIDGGPNSQMPGYFTFKDAPVVDPNTLVLTGKIDNYWYDEAGNPDGFEAIIINVPLPPGEVSIWENNVLNTFVENKLAFTTQNGEPVDNVEGRVLFTEKGHWKTIDGGRILVYEDANMQGEVAEIDPEWGMIRILNTDVTWSLLSATDRYVSLPLCVKAYIGDDEVPLTNGSFTVMLTKPLSIESISLIEISFENSEEVSVPLDELIHLQDWRNKQLVRNDSPDLYEYYRVDSPMITGTENGEELNKIIMTDLGSPDGSLHPLSEMAPDLAVSYNPDLNHGMLTFVNNGGQLGSFTIFVPITINHEWGYLSGQVIIKVHEGDMPVDAEPYAVLSDNNTVLTFYYDEHKVERNGMDIGPFNDSDKQSWYNQRESITTAVFDESFANCASLTSTFLWFYGCRNMVSISGIQYLKTDNVTDMSRMFDSCSSLTSLDVSGFNTENVTHMYDMFYMCSSLTSIDVSHFNTSNVKRMSWMFNGCKNLTSLDVSNFKTDNVTDMNSMFLGCSGLTSLDLSVFNTANVTDMYWMFSGCSKLTDIDISSFNTANVTDFRRMFYNCTSLASIQAGNAEIPAEEYANIGNPNLLVYVNEARLAPEGVQNVVVNGVAKEIVLTDNPDGKIVNNNWYCPEPFRAEKISYTRDFRQQTQIGISRGWESLALPFAVQTITHQDKGAIAPFGSDASGLHFWLRRLGHEGLISVQMIEPNTPYIISMPNSEDYASRFNLNGRVTFAAEDAYVERTEQMEDESADYMMVPTFQRMPVSEYVYALNIGEERNGRPEGSIFERNYREVRPFEAYTLHRGDQPAPLFFDLSDLEGSTTNVPDVRWMMDDGNGEWYDLQGRKLGSTLNVQRSTLKKGVYIRNGRKIVFK